MDILAAEYIYKGLKEYNESIGRPHGNEVIDEESVDPSFPLTIVSEIRNVANPSYNGSYDRVSSLGFSVEIYAPNIGEISKKQVAREIAHEMDKYMTNIGLIRASFSTDSLIRDASLYRIVMTYTGNLHENRKNIM